MIRKAMPLLAALTLGAASPEQAFLDGLGAIRLGVREAAKVSGTRPIDGDVRCETGPSLESCLVNLIESDNARNRVYALESLREFVAGNVRTREAVMKAYRNERDAVEVRKEAAKTLSRVTQYGDVRERLLAEAEFGRSAVLRAISLKALYPEVGRTATTRSEVLRVVIQIARDQQEAPAVRQGALWALFNAMDKSRARDAVLHPARWADASTRIVALRSLYTGMKDKKVLAAALTIAGNLDEAAALRAPALLLLANAEPSPEVARILQDARDGADVSLGAAARLALGADEPANAYRIKRYFHLPHTAEDGSFYDPLSKE